MSKTLEQLLFVLNDVRRAKPTTYQDLVQSRRASLNKAAEHFGVHRNTVAAKYQQMTPRNTEQFDLALWNWISKGRAKDLHSIVHVAIPPNDYQSLSDWFKSHD